MSQPVCYCSAIEPAFRHEKERGVVRVLLQAYTNTTRALQLPRVEDRRMYPQRVKRT